MAFSEDRNQLRETSAASGLQPVKGDRRAPNGLQRIPGLTNTSPAHPLLADVVERIADWDISDDAAARTLAPKATPSTAPYLLVQYRTPFGSEHQFGASRPRHQRYVHVATVLRSGVAVMRPNGALGALVVRLKPEAADRLMGDRMEDFLNAKIDLRDLFRPSEVSLLEEVLMEASDSAARFAAIESFLVRNLRESQPLPKIGHAAQRLRRNPTLSVQRLAEQLDVSERHLSRTFRAMYAASPKEFARFTRLEKVVSMRHGGSAWADIAYACGFADQAHMIRDFQAVFGESPHQFFCTSHLVLQHEGERATAQTRISQPTVPCVWECFF